MIKYQKALHRLESRKQELLGRLLSSRITNSQNKELQEIQKKLKEVTGTDKKLSKEKCQEFIDYVNQVCGLGDD